MKLKIAVSKILASVIVAGLSGSALALTPGSGTWVKESATYGTPNLQNAYVYVPANTNPAVLNGKRALMLSLHGCGQSADANVIDSKFNWQTIAEQKGMVIVAPTVPSGTSATRSSSGCWDWFGASHNRTSRDAVPLKALIDAVKGRANLDIDPNQIYITGLSSGAGETHVIGCSFPDYFAGIGENAGPALGSASLDIFSDPKVTATQVRDTCKAINGNNATYNALYATQIYNTIYGTSDGTVKPTHNVRNAEGMRLLYGTTATASSFSVAGGGSGTSWVDGNGKQRVSQISVSGMGHAWPAGAGGSGGGTYVDYTHVNYPVWITNWFFDNNLRVSQDAPPVMTSCAATVTSSSSASISGAATDNGSVASYSVTLNGATPINDNAAGSAASFSKTYTLASGYYSGSVSATDNLGQVSASCAIPQFLVGSPPAILPPTGLAVSGSTANSVSLSWNAVSGASGYNIYRNGNKVNATPNTSTAYADTGLTASTTYNYQVSSIDAAASESSLSSSVSGTSKSAWTCSITSASNYAHVQAGRAHQSLGYTYANGSNQNMGLYNTYASNTLAQTAAGYYVIGNCP